jgi:hypothetical protein
LDAIKSSEPDVSPRANRVNAVARARWVAVGASVRGHAPEILLYCAVRAVGLCVLAVMAPHVGATTALLGKWDGAWYLGIARHGYDTALTYRPNGTLVNTNIVFFPLYPALVKVFGSVLGLLHAALLISLVSGIAAAVAIRSVGEHLRDRRTGVLLAGLWGIVPTAVVESMAYPESLYTALAALTVLYLLRGRWIAAGTASLFAGLTHPTGLAAAAAVDICALIAIARRRDGWRPWLGGLLAPLGAVGYLAWVSVALGRWDGFTYMERYGWHSSPSLTGLWHQTLTTLTHHQALGYYVPIAVLALTILSALSMTVLTVGRLPIAVLAFTWVSIALGLTTSPVYFHAEARFLMPDFPVLLPVAAYLARRSGRTIAAAVGTGALLSAWYGGYLLTIWTHSP